MKPKTQAMLLQLLSMLKTDVSEYCDIETVDGESTIVYQDGSMATICQFHGTKSVLGRDQYRHLVRQLTESLGVYLGRKGFQLQVVFRRDLDAMPTLERMARQQRITADKLKLWSIEDLIDENVDTYARYVYDEECYLVFWSRPSLLDPIEGRMSAKENNAFRKSANWPAAADAQNLLRPIRFLRDRHVSYVSKVVDDLSSPDLGCSVEILDVRTALRAVRKSILPDATAPNWKPSIPGEGITFRWKEGGAPQDLSALLYPSLPSQIMTHVPRTGSLKDKNLPDPTTICMGNRVYAPLMMTVPPSDPKFFNDLFNDLNRASTYEKGVLRALPYSISFMLQGDGLGAMGLKAILASILAITSETNRNINHAIRELRERKRDGEVIAKMTVNAMTWASADPDGIAELALRKSKLTRTLQGWGGMHISEKSGNPLVPLQANALALTPKKIGELAAPPLEEAIAMLPLTRPASPFAQGSQIFRSLDGKILPYQRFSSQQTTWITLINGKPGSGKSVLMNNNNVEACLLPGMTRLPYIGVIDIGVSSSGFIDVIRDALPDDLKHLALYKRLQNAERDCINPMDTSLTLRRPLPKDREFMKNFITILVTAPERKGSPVEGMTNFVGRMIDMAFKKLDNSDDNSSAPKRYLAGYESEVDEAIAASGMALTQSTTWWEVVDHLFEHKRYYEAEVAQRHAVPTLNDLIQIANSEDVKGEYGKLDGGDLITRFSIGMREAVSDFPIFSGHTRFDIGSARVMALDLQDVAQIGSDSANKQTALMYMIARQSFMKKVAYHTDDLPFFSAKARPYYQRLISELMDEYKILCLDELHRTGGHAGLRLQLMTDGRESRKWQMELVLASQLMEDFGELTKIATTFFILDAGTEETRKWMRETIGLSPVEERALLNYVHGATEDGATFLARFSTKDATYSQLFTSSTGPMRLWALTTTAEDRKLRALVYAALPRHEARAALAARFPGGSCKRVVDSMKREQFAESAFVDDDMEATLIDSIAKDIIANYYHGAALAA